MARVGNFYFFCWRLSGIGLNQVCIVSLRGCCKGYDSMAMAIDGDTKRTAIDVTQGEKQSWLYAPVSSKQAVAMFLHGPINICS